MANQWRLLPDVGKTLVQFGLGACGHTARHDGDQGWQWRLATAVEQVGGAGMAGQLMQLGGGRQMSGKNGERGVITT